MTGGGRPRGIILEHCPCGEAWAHFRDPDAQRFTEEMVHRHGPTLTWTVGEESFVVARYYLALHGLSGSNTDIGFPRLGQPGCLIFPELPAITCARCGLASWNANDVRHRFCGKCNVFHQG
jgi:hypothetical protein